MIKISFLFIISLSTTLALLTIPPCAYAFVVPAKFCSSPRGGRNTVIKTDGRMNYYPSSTSRESSTIIISSPLSMASLSSTNMHLHDKITTVVGKTASTFVSLTFFCILAYQRDAIILSLWIGSILNAILSKVAKKVLNHDRPAELQDSNKIKLKPSDGGMPSSHAMSLSFIGTSIIGGIVPVEHRLVAAVAVLIYSTIALRYRVRDHLHTVDQVFVGVMLGTVNALAWLKFGLGPVLSYVQHHCVSGETGLFPYSALTIPIVVGILVVGSFERRIALWMKNKRDKERMNMFSE